MLRSLLAAVGCGQRGTRADHGAEMSAGRPGAGDAVTEVGSGQWDCEWDS